MKENANSSCECWFLDVGQGTSNVILLGGGRAIVIDCGPKSSTETLELLKRHVDTIEVLIISHNDKDHDGNVQEILSQYRRAINHIFFLKDRQPVSNIKTFALLNTPQFKDDFPEPKRLEGDQVVFSENDLNLCVLYPSMMDNLANESCPNATSGILRLKCGSRKIVYSGDATIEAWESFSQKYKQIPLVCDVMTIPHHGGNISDHNEAISQTRLYSEVIRPTYGIVSVGSINSYSHPISEAISAVSNSGAMVLCTQMTNKCCSELENIRQVTRAIYQPSRSMKEECKTNAGKSKNVACFGSVVVEIVNDEVKVSNLSSFCTAFRKFQEIPSF
jgi:competence protein ComEC